MQKGILIGTLIFFMAFTSQAYAATTPTPNVTNSPKLDKQINQLKDKIASRVSQLNLVEKRGIIGTIKEIKGNKIILTDINGHMISADVDEITKFTSVTARRTASVSDLTKGMQISVLGLYNKESKRILARFIKIEVIPVRYSGTITTLDPKNFIVTATTDDQKEIKINVNTTTKLLSYTKDASELTKYGFSKLAVGDRITVVGYPDKKDPTLTNADRLIVYIGTPKNPNITVATPTPGTTIAPTSAGAKKINPIR